MQNAGPDLPLVSRRAELAVLIGVIDAASPRPHLAASIVPVRIASSARRATSGKSALTVAVWWRWISLASFDVGKMSHECSGGS